MRSFLLGLLILASAYAQPPIPSTIPNGGGGGGATGPTGPQGPTGPAGANGATGATGSGSGSSVVSFSVMSQIVGGGNFDLLTTGPTGAAGTAAACSTPDSANGNLDGICQFANGATNWLAGHFYLGSSTTVGANYADPLKITITNLNSTATTGSVTPLYYDFCLPVGSLATTSSYALATSLFSAITMRGTASTRNESGTVSRTTGCPADSIYYWMLGINNGLGSSALVGIKNIVFVAPGISR